MCVCPREMVAIMASGNIIIVGAGQAAAQVAISLRAGGFVGKITMFGEEAEPPYQRPPLSKAYLSGAMDRTRVTLKPLEAWAQDQIEIALSTTITHIDRAAKTVTTQSGAVHTYDWLILATGSRVRRLDCAGADAPQVHYLRSFDDVDRLRADFAPSKRLVVVGGGYIGLEVAAVARKAGLEVTIVEAAERVLARVAPPVISGFFEDLHRAAGVTILTGARLSHIVAAPDVTALALADGSLIPADVILIGIGILPNAELAAEAGLSTRDGIDTDADARTSDPSIFAIGDCASRPLVHYGDRRGRLESVHNALEQGKLAAAAILGLPRPVEETPWFWSDQYDVKLQIAGLSQGATRHVVRGDPASKRFAVFHLDADNRLLAVDAINAAPEFIVAKQVIARHGRLAPETLADMSISMKDIGAGASA
jgi:3-phenylpropionate/trans-cinnamate dioxygenase ferredoxin reductase subunit